MGRAGHHRGDARHGTDQRHHSQGGDTGARLGAVADPEPSWAGGGLTVSGCPLCAGRCPGPRGVTAVTPLAPCFLTCKAQLPPQPSCTKEPCKAAFATHQNQQGRTQTPNSGHERGQNTAHTGSLRRVPRGEANPAWHNSGAESVSHTPLPAFGHGGRSLSCTARICALEHVWHQGLKPCNRRAPRMQSPLTAREKPWC